jgi:heat shock protein HtpX
MTSIVRINTIKVYIFMALLTMVLGILGTLVSSYFEWGLSGTGVFLIISGVINFIAFYFSDRLLLRASHAEPLTRAQVPELFTMVEELSNSAKIPVPKLYLIRDSSMNAFATGRNPQHAAVAVTLGLLENLDPAEVRAVLGHEISHVRNGDMRLMAVVSILAGFISIVADIYWRSGVAAKAGEKDRSGTVAFIGLFISLIAPLAAMLVQLAISRSREFMADASGAELSNGAASLVSALRKISLDRRPLPYASPATAHLYFSSPLQVGSFIDRAFSTHPPLEERIAALMRIEGAK